MPGLRLVLLLPEFRHRFTRKLVPLLFPARLVDRQPGVVATGRGSGGLRASVDVRVNWAARCAAWTILTHDSELPGSSLLVRGGQAG